MDEHRQPESVRLSVRERDVHGCGVNNRNKNKWTGTFQIFTVGKLPLAHRKSVGEDVLGAESHVGESVVHAERRGRPCLQLEENERADARGRLRTRPPNGWD